MKTRISLSVFAIVSVLMVQAQSTERFIRIIGNSEHTYISDISRVYFTVSEIAPNEYKKISYKPFEKSYDEFVAKLQEFGFSEKEIASSNAEINKYHKTKTKNYYIDIDDRSELDKFSGLQNEGFKVKEVKYLYANIDADIENLLSLDAIHDAQRKARKLCSEVDLKLGKILNIEDKSSGCCSSIPESREPTTIKKYRVTVTFELIDK